MTGRQIFLAIVPFRLELVHYYLSLDIIVQDQQNFDVCHIFINLHRILITTIISIKRAVLTNSNKHPLASKMIACNSENLN